MDKSDHCREVYARYGHAMYRAQCVEQSITQLIVFFDFFPNNLSKISSKADWEKGIDEFDGELSSKTMGQLVKSLTGLGAVDTSIENKLRVALSERNMLAHRFFVDHALNFVSEKGRDLMIFALHECCALFDEIEDILNPITYSLCEKYGLTQELLKKIETEMFEGANGDLPPP